MAGVARGPLQWNAQMRYKRGTMVRSLLHVATVFLSSLLLFLIQPMLGKTMLPWFGGSAGVWTTAMLFFQTVLLLGYVYAHCATRYLPAPARIGLHVAMLAVSCVLLPVAPWKLWSGQASSDPVPEIALLLAMSIGLPYFLLSSTSPLVQAWSARQGSSVYRLYALSNLASLGALFLYPVLLEPWIDTKRQLQWWSGGYAAFVAFSLTACLLSGRVTEVESESAPASSAQRLLWVALAACPSVLWLAMANTLSQNLAPVPLLWVLPLGIYLLSLVLCFDQERWYRPSHYRIALPVSWVVIGYGLLWSAPVGVRTQVALASGALLVCCMFCHGELARRKPDTAQLTGFYVMVALGGALGGIFVGLVAPRLFDRFLELPIAIAGCVILAMSLLYGLPPRRIVRLAVLAAVGVVFAAKVNDARGNTLVRERNFYGALEVTQTGDLRVLNSGVIQHGSEFMDPARSRQATAYYGPESGVAQAIRAMGDRPLRVALIGLGTGALAAYARPGDLYRFYELNPAVIDLARTQFRYLSESAGKIEVVAGDGRRELSRAPGGWFDMVILDAFSGDSIPAHLLTREASAIYFGRLKRDGVVAVHITNRYVNLEGVVRGPAEETGRRVLVIESGADPAQATHSATWMVITGNREVLARLDDTARRPTAPARIWTDDFSNLFGVLR